jgi:arabinose-5-phosphate isomerase
MIPEKAIEAAFKTIEQEAQALHALLHTLDRQCIGQMLLRLFECKGRVVFTGIGKSAIIAQKIVATFNSTGTPALFLHAADAIHGDLGMVSPADIVVCISKSGESPEIKVLVPLVQNMGNPLFAICSEAQSYLAKRADLLLYAAVSAEAEPNNLAPTSSTTVQVAIGDALAVGLMQLRGFSPDDFGRFHPGGALGKRLYLRASDLCAQHEKPMVGPDQSLKEVIVEMTSKRLGATAVVDENGAVLGIITDGDLRRLLETHDSFGALKACDIMTAGPFSVSAQEPAVEILNSIRKHKITQIIVLDQGQYYGMVHLHDLVREGII